MSENQEKSFHNLAEQFSTQRISPSLATCLLETVCSLLNQGNQLPTGAIKELLTKTPEEIQHTLQQIQPSENSSAESNTSHTKT